MRVSEQSFSGSALDRHVLEVELSLSIEICLVSLASL